MAITLKVGESKTIQLYREEVNPNFTGVSSVNVDVTWESNDTNVATVASGLSMGQGSATSSAIVTAIWMGNATITATTADGGVDTIAIVVTDPDTSPVRIGVQ